jgi:hypothetical protein
MKKLLLTAIAAVPFAMGFSISASAQNSPLMPGEYEDVAMIDIADGGSVDYANYLAGSWRKNQEFAKSKGWITGYQVFENVYPRPGEPDLYLVVRFNSLPDAAEEERRNQAYRDFVKQSDAQMAAESGNRLKIRTVMGVSLLRELKFR